MPSSYSPNLRVELPDFREQQGIWNLTINNTFGKLYEQAIAGNLDINLAFGDRALSAFNAAIDESRNASIVCSGIPSGAVTITIPDTFKVYDIHNTTGVAVIIKTSYSEYECKPFTYSWVYNNQDKSEVIGRTITVEIAQALAKSNVSGFLSELGIAPISSPKLTGKPTAPTPPRGDISERIATTAFVRDNAFPAGGIAPFTGAVKDIPKGYFLCDGSNNTPNLSGMFVLGAGSGYSQGSTGGYRDAVIVSHNHGGITGGQSANHTHSGNTNAAGNHSHSGVLSTRGNLTARPGSDPFNGGYPGSTWASGDHSHTSTTGGNDASHTHSIPYAGSSGKDKNLPPYYVFAFIMRGL